MFLNSSLTFYIKMFNSPMTGIGALRKVKMRTLTCAVLNVCCKCRNLIKDRSITETNCQFKIKLR